jgi:hypothetical protein
MRELLAYLASVILLPAMAAAMIAAPAMFGTLRRRTAVVDACIGVALAAAFLIAFIHEVEPNALLRQLPVELPGDDAPFERWHRVALVALLLMLVSPVLALAATWRPAARSAMATWMALVAGVLVALLVEFPGATGMTRAMTGATCAACAFMLSRVGGMAALCACTVTFIGVAVFAALNAFPSLAAISAATALASMVLAVLGWMGGRSAGEPRALVVAGAASTVMGTLAGTSAACIGAYADRAPAWAWIAVALAAPLSTLLLARLRSASKRNGTT